MSSSFADVQRCAPFSYIFYSLIFFIVALLLLICLAVGKYKEKNIISGVIRKGEYHQIQSNLSGSIAKIYVGEGALVKSGQPLFELVGINSDTMSGKNNVKIDQIKIIEKYLQQVRNLRTTFIQQFPNFDSTFIKANQANQSAKKYIEETIPSSNQIKTLTIDKLLNTRKLEELGAANKTDVSDIKKELLKSEIAIEEINQSLANLQQSGSEIELKKLTTNKDHLLSILRLDDQISQLEQQLINLKLSVSVTVTAQYDGVVNTIYVRHGDHYSAGSSMGVIRSIRIQDTTLIFDVDPSMIGLIDPSQDLVVRVSTFPYENYGVLTAHISSIAQTLKLNTSSSKNSYQVKAKLLPRPSDRISNNALMDGMEILTYVSQPPLTLFEWLFLPIKRAYIRNPEIISQ